MDKKLDASFERVEKALAVLIDSMSKYTPSEKAANGVVKAQRELFLGLEELEIHQRNVARIRQLEQETEALDAQTKQTISALWEMRKELVAVAPTKFTPTKEEKYPFTTQQLLDYARRISRNTLPPPGVTNGVDLSPAAPTTPDDQSAGGPNGSFANSIGGGGGSDPGTAASTPAPGVQDSFVSQAPSQSLTGATELPVHLKPAVNPLENAPFFTFPTIDRIRSGALAQYQDLVNRGIDPKIYDPEEEERRLKQEEQERKEAEERARQEMEEQERRMREERERMARERELARQQQQQEGGIDRRGSVLAPGQGGGQPGRSAPKQFTFLDEDDDDDED
ncbi:vitamin-D-receptor interacting mediator subunit 4-domain-containing protein [Apiosordaria backusii]|uniref:Mediator of RNA polymerase II transcription subunit 4 n=1 Tax=Apiosordaria backusii TaxID=314023 RepID=A0AA40DI03_9PEZI|nr:vitamin-D-receptor interacting mediator subunit 4-domain-containing protein [Apiosordaria backusii]